MSTYSAMILRTAGLIGYWQLGADPSDSGPNHLNGITYGPVVFGQPGALSPVGPQESSTHVAESSRVTIPYAAAMNITIANAYTVEFWLKFDSVRNYNAGVTRGSGPYPLPFDFYVDGNGTGTFLHRNGDGGLAMASGPGFGVTTWQHVALTYDGSTIRLYRNGSLVGSSATAGVQDGSQPMIFGSRDDAVTQLIGAIEKIAYYARALTTAELFGHAAYRPAPGATLWIESDNGVVDINRNPITDGASVGFVADRSGNGGEMFGPQPAFMPTWHLNGLNGLPIIRTSAHNSGLFNQVNYPAPFTAFVVARQIGPTRGRVLTSFTNNWLCGWWAGLEDIAYYEGWIAGEYAGGAHVGATNDWKLYTGGSAGGQSYLRSNGAMIQPANGGGVGGPNGIGIGHWPGGGDGEPSDTEFAALLIYPAGLSDADRQQTEQYLRERWFTTPSSLLLKRRRSA